MRVASWLAGAVVVSVASLACTVTTVREIPVEAGPGGDGGRASTDTSAANDGGKRTPAGTRCEKLCEAAASARCSGDATCVADCEADSKKIPAGCAKQSEALEDCAIAKGTFTCSESGKPMAEGCDAEGTALFQCITGAGPSGPSACGREMTTLACEACKTAKCCAPSAACSSDPGCIAIIDCYAREQCETDACFERCEQTNPSGVAKLNTFLQCLQTNCATECGGGA